MGNVTGSKRTSIKPFQCLAERRRRGVVDVLRGEPLGVSETDLAARVVARATGRPLVEVTEAEHRRALVSLHHTDLPKLADAELVVRDEEADRVRIADHPALDDPGVRRALAPEADDDAVDAVFRGLAHPRRRRVLAVLNDLYQPIEPQKLAARVAAREEGCPHREVPSGAVEHVRSSLEHVHLPTLRDAGLVHLDGDDGRVTYDGDPLLRTEWLAAEPPADAPAPDDGGRLDDDLQTLEGRREIVTHGQSLCERADDELFLLFTRTGLLEEGCFARIEDAVERGVDVYLGSPSPTVRDLVRERVPGATIWEPELDWLTLPQDRARLGRLVFADRETIMLATLGDGTEGGVDRETAVAAEGPDNGLVVLVRELLGSRLDAFEAEDEDEGFPSQLPL